MRKLANAAIGMALVAVAGCGGTAATPPARVAVTHFTVPASPTTTAAVGAGAASPDVLARSSMAATVTGRPVRIMPVGDSLTQGTDPEDPSKAQTYRGYLEARLRAAGYDVDFVGSDRTLPIAGSDPDSEGHGGFTIGPDGSNLCATCPPANVSDNIGGWVERNQPDVILLLIGINDLFPIETRTNGALRPVVPEDAPAKLVALVDRMEAVAPNAEILVASYPPLPFARSAGPDTMARFTALNDAARLAGSRGGRVHYVPLFEALSPSWTLVDTVSDGVHPSILGGDKMASVFEAVLTPLLADPS
ncbi:MAG: GDSL-type esterase/lipase family protein [Acidimicrobiales bacterium]